MKISDQAKSLFLWLIYLSYRYRIDTDKDEQVDELVIAEATSGFKIQKGLDHLWALLGLPTVTMTLETIRNYNCDKVDNICC